MCYKDDCFFIWIFYFLTYLVRYIYIIFFAFAPLRVEIYLTRYFHSRFVFTRMRNKIKAKKSIHLFVQARLVMRA